MKNILLFSAIVLMALAAGTYYATRSNLFSIAGGEVATDSTRMGSQEKNQNEVKNVSKDNCISDDCLTVQDLDYPVGSLSQEAITALNSAIQDEYMAHATYQKVIESFGMVRPFSMIIRAEESHISSLKSLFDKYDLPIPEDTWYSKVTSPRSVQVACQVGVEAEIANAKLYRDVLLPSVKQYEDITVVFTNLMNASQEKHLVAFERCK